MVVGKIEFGFPNEQTLVVVLKLQVVVLVVRVVCHARTHKPTPVPLQSEIVILRRVVKRIADLVVKDSLTADRGEKIAPVIVRVAVALRRGGICGRYVRRSQRIGLFARDIACVVVGVGISFVKLLVVLADKLTEVVVIISCFGGCGCVVLCDRCYDLCDISIIVVGVGICGILRIRGACVAAERLYSRRKEIENRQD